MGLPHVQIKHQDPQNWGKLGAKGGLDGNKKGKKGGTN